MKVRAFVDFLVRTYGIDGDIEVTDSCYGGMYIEPLESDKDDSLITYMTFDGLERVVTGERLDAELSKV